MNPKKIFLKSTLLAAILGLTTTINSMPPEAPTNQLSPPIIQGVPPVESIKSNLQSQSKPLPKFSKPQENAPLPNNFHLHVAPDLPKTPKRPDIRQVPVEVKQVPIEVPVEVEIRAAPEKTETRGIIKRILPAIKNMFPAKRESSTQSSPPQYLEPLPQYQEQVHQIVSSLNLPQFPLASATIHGKKSFFRTSYTLGDVHTVEYQHQAGYNIIDTLEELGDLAQKVSEVYDARVNPQTFESLAESRGMSKDVVRQLEPQAYTNQSSAYDRLADLGSHRNRVTGYRNAKKQLKVIGNINDVLRLKGARK